jgi:hypothetical protein
MKHKTDDLRSRIAAIDGTPLASKLALRGMDSIKRELSQRVTRAKAQQIDSAKQTKRIFAPFLKTITQDKSAKDAMLEIQRLAHAEIQRAVKPARAPKFAPVKPQIKSGSIIRIYVPPYNYGYQETNGFGATADAWTNVGEFLAWSNPYSASVGPYSDSAAAGVGIYFRPVAEDSFVRFSPLIKYTYSWRDRSQGGFTAHTSGSLAIRVVSFDLRGGDMRIEQDPRYPIWNDGTGWWDTHSDTNQDWPYFPNQQVYFQATSSRQYIMWVWGYTYADDHGDDFAGSGSWSYGWVEPIVVFAVTQEYA